MDIDSEVGEGFNNFDVVTGNWHKGTWEEGSVGSLDLSLHPVDSYKHRRSETTPRRICSLKSLITLKKIRISLRQGERRTKTLREVVAVI